jgi:co-chaperonin GroES (HSP10)
MKTYEAKDVHDWDGIKALGDAVFIELVGIITKTRTGIHVPDTARLDVWVVIAAGPEVKSVAVGDRVMFGGQGTSNVDGRIFCARKEEDVIAILTMPPEAAEADPSIPEVVEQMPMVPRGANGASRARIVRPH